MSHSTFNRRWAGVILEAVSRHQVKHVCIAPGSRSAPLTLAAASREKLICHTHVDERGLGHLALGLAKSTGQPVAIIVTSGTAVANLYPAIIEARLTGERLIILSADRPAELLDCGANQAIDQTGLFACHAVSLNLPRPTPDIAASWLVSAIDSLLGQQEFGAVQINCPFAEPLYGGDPEAYKHWQEALGDWWQDDGPWLQQVAARATPVMPEWLRWRQARGVVIAGKMSPQEGIAVARWASELGWPLIADVQSHCGQPLPAAEIWLQHPQAIEWLSAADMVVQFGSHLTGKALCRWLATAKPEQFWLIEAMPPRRDPANHRGSRIVADIRQWLAAHPASPQSAWCPALADRVKTLSASFHPPLFSEAGLAANLAALLPEQGVLFLGNSLTIRLVDAFAQLPPGYPVFANRGASGIDGLLATAAGVQRGSRKPLLAIVGDISALYDLNSLALLRQASAPVVLIVINNAGGQIFSLLPTPEAERERFFLMPQQVDFSAAAQLFGLDFHRPANAQELTAAIEQGWRGQATLIELQVENAEGALTLAAAGKGDCR
ncbi:2-succinyl-5-enolpyruvyl-6-hydroxy-3-cyclohexene-1-carboxylic-acid synthase [Erwinia billingiae]|uniref:2-succinyl-5-enolpyruvyl-6-hydroxy-3- cyclohexene-1-carboxylic-acid synthase n=1 Tax=Erwinia billingiae TaxID=182337 RepID=UPI002247777A|nr:2-succinyl-5-enolpyruvyl-6-hydroxy-3-cyclohexene-1-carboxylic-acid synthase [Erwinia billingiae]MCX0501107.1 2-succinyl-5-enolpyruvyl-6-hydroxy-3-cyclohexene-1-carboxylic-acid synthase [Erwinia billingiae]